MRTKILNADSPEAIELASRLLAQGELVAFPTETVYGLGANALDREAVLSIFAAKGRPADNPLIVHIWHRNQLEELCGIPEGAEQLMDAFWPGPLTMLFPRKPKIPLEVTAGLPTVAIRMPSMPCTRKLLETCGLPIAEGRIPLILDGGECLVGLESTVLDLTRGEPVILRPGGITRDMIESVLHKEVRIAGSVLRPLKPDEKALSPGMRYRHYAPEGCVTLVEGPEEAVLESLRMNCLRDRSEGKRSCVLCFTEHMSRLSDCDPHDLGSKTDEREVAHRLFDTLRRLDEEGMETIYSEVVPPEGVGLAVMNRLGRAAAFRSIRAGQENNN